MREGSSRKRDERTPPHVIRRNGNTSVTRSSLSLDCPARLAVGGLRHAGRARFRPEHVDDAASTTQAPAALPSLLHGPCHRHPGACGVLACRPAARTDWRTGAGERRRYRFPAFAAGLAVAADRGGAAPAAHHAAACRHDRDRGRTPRQRVAPGRYRTGTPCAQVTAPAATRAAAGRGAPGTGPAVPACDLRPARRHPGRLRRRIAYAAARLVVVPRCRGALHRDDRAAQRRALPALDDGLALPDAGTRERAYGAASQPSPGQRYTPAPGREGVGACAHRAVT